MQKDVTSYGKRTYSNCQSNSIRKRCQNKPEHTLGENIEATQNLKVWQGYNFSADLFKLS